MNDVSLFPKHVSSREKGKISLTRKKADPGKNKNAPQEGPELNQWAPNVFMAYLHHAVCVIRLLSVAETIPYPSPDKSLWLTDIKWFVRKNA